MKYLLFFVVLIGISDLSIHAQEAQIGDGSPTLLVWPFENSFYIDQESSSHSWTMICGSGCGYHRNSDYFALDWARRSISSCGNIFNAPLSGTVLCAIIGSDSGYGQQIVIQSDQDSNYAFRIAHMQEVWVSRGDFVYAGEPIGRVGDTGNGGCHGHLAVYKNIYDIAERPIISGDTTQYYQKAIDYLRIGSFVPTPYEDDTYFSQTFGFLNTGGLKADLFSFGSYEIAIEDSLRLQARVFNTGSRVWEGRIGFEMQQREAFFSNIGTPLWQTDQLSIGPGDTITIQETIAVDVFPPETYIGFLLFLSEEFYEFESRNVTIKTPLRNRWFELLSKAACNKDEPNDERSTATPLFDKPLISSTIKKEKTGFLSVFEDEKDLYSFSTEKSGRMTIAFPDTSRFKVKVLDESGLILLDWTSGSFSFLTSTDNKYYIEISGRNDCTTPYSFQYQWQTVNDVIWSLKSYLEIGNEFIVLSDVELEWHVFDMMGRQLFSSGKEKMGKGKYFFSIPLENPSPGVYFATLYLNGKLVEHKKFFWTN